MRSTVVALALLVLVGCGAPAPGPDALGAQAGRLYRDTVAAAVKAVEAKPDPATARAALTPILEGAQAKLVDLGRKREAYRAADKATFDAALAKGVTSLAPDTFEQLTALARHYNAIDPAVGRLLSGVNVVTQFAAFELLRKQNPDAAERYGVR